MPSLQNYLGLMYAEGRGVAHDYVSAHKWLNLAGVQGLETARHRRDALAEDMTAEQIADAQDAARATFE